MPQKLGMSAIKDRADQGLGSPDFRFAPRRITNSGPQTQIVRLRSAVLVGPSDFTAGYIQSLTQATKGHKPTGLGTAGGL